MGARRPFMADGSQKRLNTDRLMLSIGDDWHAVNRWIDGVRDSTMVQYNGVRGREL